MLKICCRVRQVLQVQEALAVVSTELIIRGFENRSRGDIDLFSCAEEEVSLFTACPCR
jgi:hypothetical protein